MSSRAWWLALATAVAGFIAGWLLARSGDAAPATIATGAAMQTQCSPLPAGPAVSPAGTVSLEDVRRVVREELASAGAHPTGAATEPRSTADAEPPTPAQAAAMARAGMLLEGALARREFTEADVDAMRTEFHQLSPAQQAEIMQRYAVAVNQGRIVPQTDRIPF